MLYHIIPSLMSFLLIHTGATIRFAYHRLVIRDKYSYHALTTNSPIFEESQESYKEQFKRWKETQMRHNQKWKEELTQAQQQELALLQKEGMNKEEALQLMLASGDINPIDTDIYPRNPEYFTNRTLDGVIGLCFLVSLVLAIHFL